MLVGVLAVSTSAPLIAAMTVPALAIAFWRNGFATAALAPVAVAGRRSELAGLRRGDLVMTVLAGLALAVHFGTWVSSVKMTSVASSTALVCLQIAWVVAWQMVRGERFGRLVVAGLAVAFAGVLVVSGVDVALSARKAAGDGLALLGGVAAAGYMLLGARVRREVSTTAYTFCCYGTCAAVLAATCAVARQPLAGYPLRQWAMLVAVTVAAQLLGHSVFNHLLAVTGPMLVSLALLLEVPGASLIAAFALGQQPPVAALVGLAVILGGTAMVVVGRRERALDAAPVD